MRVLLFLFTVLIDLRFSNERRIQFNGRIQFDESNVPKFAYFRRRRDSLKIRKFTWVFYELNIIF